jgi:hypothetical protein
MIVGGSTWEVTSDGFHAQQFPGHLIDKPIEHRSLLTVVEPEGLSLSPADGYPKVMFIVQGDTKKRRYWCFEPEFWKYCSPATRACCYCGTEISLTALQGRASLKCPNPDCGKTVYVTTDDRLKREP